MMKRRAINIARNVCHNNTQRRSSSSTHSQISPSLSIEEKESLSETGYLWLKNAIPQNVARNVQKRIHHLLDNFDPSSTTSIFQSHRTDEQNKGIYKDQYFLESGDKIRFFWEQFAFDENGNLKMEPALAINKIGHAMHWLDPYIHSYVYGFLPQLAYDVGLKEPKALQSMYIFKQPNIGGGLDPHQDSTFLYTEPVTSVHAFWLCIDDTFIENGCIWVSPGTHKDPKIGLRNRFQRKADDNKCLEMVPLIENGEIPKGNGVPIEAKCGDLLILHGQCIHWSEMNHSENPRHALMMHVIDGQYDYPKNNWLQYTNGEIPSFTNQDVLNQHKIRQKIINY